jgi:hypothetical protein
MLGEGGLLHVDMFAHSRSGNAFQVRADSQRPLHSQTGTCFALQLTAPEPASPVAPIAVEDSEVTVSIKSNPIFNQQQQAQQQRPQPWQQQSPLPADRSLRLSDLQMSPENSGLMTESSGGRGQGMCGGAATEHSQSP